MKAVIVMALALSIQGYATPGRIEVRSEVRGLGEVEATLVRLGATAARESAGALYREAEGLMGESKGEVPVRDGILRSTGHVELPEIGGSGVAVRLGYNTPYALRQHEDLTFRHTVGKARYLADPLERRAPTMDQRMAADLKSRLGL